MGDTAASPESKRPPGQCCTHVYIDGCNAPLVSHGTPAATASTILRSGQLLAAVDTSGRSAADMAAESTWGEPSDYFEYVMFANGRCTAPEAVARSRSLGRDVEPIDLRSGYPTAVRFYFDWSDLIAREDAAFDGVHPVKVRGPVELSDHLIAVVVHSRHEGVVAAAAESPVADRLCVLDLVDPPPHEWADAANAAAVTRR